MANIYQNMKTLRRLFLLLWLVHKLYSIFPCPIIHFGPDIVVQHWTRSLSERIKLVLALVCSRAATDNFFFAEWTVAHFPVTHDETPTEERALFPALTFMFTQHPRPVIRGDVAHKKKKKKNSYWRHGVYVGLKEALFRDASAFTTKRMPYGWLVITCLREID